MLRSRPTQLAGASKAQRGFFFNNEEKAIRLLPFRLGVIIHPRKAALTHDQPLLTFFPVRTHSRSRSRHYSTFHVSSKPTGSSKVKRERHEGRPFRASVLLPSSDKSGRRGGAKSREASKAGSKMSSGCLCLPGYKKKDGSYPSAATKPAAGYPYKTLLQKPNHPTPPPSKKGMDAIERLQIGFKEFKTEIYDKKPELFEPLKAGQAPRYMIFACADSRVCPSVTLGLQPGEAFTVRNIAAMVPPYDKNRYTGIGSAIEYAVCALKVEVLTVIGHSRCGGIKALLSLKDGASDSFHFVEDWVRIGFLAKKKVQTQHASVPFDDQCNILEKEAVNVSLDNLLTYPWVKEGVARGTLKLVGGRYDFVNGVFDTWEK